MAPWGLPGRKCITTTRKGKTSRIAVKNLNVLVPVDKSGGGVLVWVFTWEGPYRMLTFVRDQPTSNLIWAARPWQASTHRAPPTSA